MIRPNSHKGEGEPTMIPMTIEIVKIINQKKKDTK
jgi:hypothetical protein